MVIPELGLTVRTIYGIGRNYAEHAKELGNEVPKEPIVFTKPLSSLQWGNGQILLPQASKQVDHEVEIVIAIGRNGRFFPETAAEKLIAGYAIGIDVTARDLQKKAKQEGLPWTLCKGFPTFAPVGRFVEEPLLPLQFTLEVNGQMRQQGTSSQMIYSIPQLLVHLGKTFGLYPGDLIFTGTPAGVGQLRDGDKVTAKLQDTSSHLEMTVKETKLSE